MDTEEDGWDENLTQNLPLYPDELGSWPGGEADYLSAPADGRDINAEPVAFAPRRGAGQPWPLLREGGQGREEVQEKVFSIWCAYESHCASSSQAEKCVVDGVELPVYQRPPGYEYEHVRQLAEHASKFEIATFIWRAVPLSSQVPTPPRCVALFY